MDTWVIVLAIALPIQLLLGTVLMALALWILSGDDASPFQLNGRVVTWAKCLGINGAVLLIRVVALFLLRSGGVGAAGIVAILSIAVWVVGVMLLFERSFAQAVLLAMSIWLLNLLLEKLVLNPLLS